MKDLYLPEKDPRLTVERYKRTYDQDEELGLNDIKTENYQEEHSSHHMSPIVESGEPNCQQQQAANKPPTRTVQVKPVLRNAAATASEHIHHPLATPPTKVKYLKFDSRPATVYDSYTDAASSCGGFTSGGASDSDADETNRMLVTANLLELGRSGRYLITRDTPPSASPVAAASAAPAPSKLLRPPPLSPTAGERRLSDKAGHFISGRLFLKYHSLSLFLSSTEALFQY